MHIYTSINIYIHNLTLNLHLIIHSCYLGDAFRCESCPYKVLFYPPNPAHPPPISSLGTPPHVWIQILRPSFMHAHTRSPICTRANTHHNAHTCARPHAHKKLSFFFSRSLALFSSLFLSLSHTHTRSLPGTHTFKNIARVHTHTHTHTHTQTHAV